MARNYVNLTVHSRVLSTLNMMPIREAIKCRPFEPFEIIMSSGERHAINHPDCLLILPTKIAIGDFVSDRLITLSLQHITELWPILPPTNDMSMCWKGGVKYLFVFEFVRHGNQALFQLLPRFSRFGGWHLYRSALISLLQWSFRAKDISRNASRHSSQFPHSGAEIAEA